MSGAYSKDKPSSWSVFVRSVAQYKFLYVALLTGAYVTFILKTGLVVWVKVLFLVLNPMTLFMGSILYTQRDELYNSYLLFESFFIVQKQKKERRRREENKKIH